MADTSPSPSSSSSIILSDILGTQKSINIFSNLCNSISTVSSRLDTSSANTTLLAPLNGAIASLPRKPWEDPHDYNALGSAAYAGQEGEDRAQRNLRRFVEAHVVPWSPWREGERVQTMGGGTVWWEVKDGRQVIMPGDVEVERIVSKVSNGEVWILKGVVNYA
ncbi:Hypothetical predicted protein [Lecanosticta acicola]|uniref:FAS1 domain-containing protein n=1 Tax=Lecanosticta acicola TaxID=111012 RepID=A0AAI8Z417_9PEZI|nr:Hypothetical predicted protein [Lecanosticta acicola]